MAQSMLYVQKSLFTLIDKPDFNFRLPTLSQTTWDNIVHDDEERERLEFTGDAYMTAAVGDALYRVMPQGSPFLYTVARSALTANRTFAHIMERMGFSTAGQSIKSMGDAFESIIGAKQKEDPAALDEWFQSQYMQLLAYSANVCRSLPEKGKAAKSRSLLASIRLRAMGYGSPAKQKRPTFSSPRTRLKKKIKNRTLYNSPTTRPRRTIDLTADSDWEDQHDEEIVQISFEQFSQRAKPPPITNVKDPTVLGASTNPIVVD